MASGKSKMGRPRAGEPSRSDFVRRHPNLSAPDVVAKAKEVGILMSDHLVRKVRRKDGVIGPKAKRRRKDGRISAADFIRSMPPKMPARDVVDAAKKQGISMFKSYVYRLRAASSSTPADAVSERRDRMPAYPRKNEETRAVRGRTKRGAHTAAKSAGRPAARAPTNRVVAFKTLALDLGVARARAALDDLERGLAALLR
jgi:hypothetical protein